MCLPSNGALRMLYIMTFTEISKISIWNAIIWKQWELVKMPNCAFINGCCAPSLWLAIFTVWHFHVMHLQLKMCNDSRCLPADLPDWHGQCRGVALVFLIRWPPHLSITPLLCYDSKSREARGFVYNIRLITFVNKTCRICNHTVISRLHCFVDFSYNYLKFVEVSSAGALGCYIISDIQSYMVTSIDFYKSTC